MEMIMKPGVFRLHHMYAHRCGAGRRKFGNMEIRAIFAKQNNVTEYRAAFPVAAVVQNVGSHATTHESAPHPTISHRPMQAIRRRAPTQ